MGIRSGLAAMAIGTVMLAACAATTGSIVGPTPAGVKLAGSPPATGLILPDTMNGLPVLSVEAAIGAHDAGAFPDDSLLAVGGWLEMTLGPSCPYDPSNPNPAALERVCGWMDHVLARDPQALAATINEGSSSETYGRAPTGPYLAPRQGEGGIINEAEYDHPPQTGDGYAPRAAVIVGHFHDPRADLCPPAKRTGCDSEFVADQVAWLDGQALGPSFWVGDLSGRALTARLDASEVTAAVTAAAPPGSSIVWMSGIDAADLAVVDPRPRLSVAPDAIVWFVRYAVPLRAGSGTLGPDTKSQPSRAGSSGWLIIGDANGLVLAQGH